MTNRPSLQAIGESQNDETSLRFQLAKAYYYTWAKILFFSGAAVTLTLALVSPLVLLFSPGAGPALGAVAGVWIFVSRLVLDRYRRDLQLKGATVQEYFDCRVLALPWNDALARRIADEELNAASRRARRSKRRVDQARDWYATPIDLPWPRSVLISQRSNAVWACRQHRAYGRTVAVAAVLWAVVGVVVAVADGASLTTYLVTIALSSLPAFLDASELARAHSASARDREIVRDQMDELIETGAAGTDEMREVQDQLFLLRRDGPPVPEWFYNVIRPGYEEDMKYAVEEVAKRFQKGDS